MTVSLRLALVVAMCGLFASSVAADSAYEGKRILWVDSYHQGFEWPDGVGRGIRRVLETTAVELEVFHMDTKRKSTEEDCRRAGREALDAIERFKPDVVIASDDNAQRCLVVPYLLERGTPVAFCGVNWDAMAYGYPTPSVTGMIEVHLVEPMVELLRRFAKGDRVAYLSADVETEHKNFDVLDDRFFGGKLQRLLAKDFAQFKRLYLQAQQEADLLLIGNYSGILDWDPDEAERFMLANAAIPSGCFDEYMIRYALFSMGKIPEEQGEFAAQAALRILDGAAPGDIPITNSKQILLTANLEMAEALGVALPLSVLKMAKVVGRVPGPDASFPAKQP